MKNAIIFALTMLIFGSQGIAEDKLPKRANKFNFGFQVNNYQNDFGIGIQLTSPYFAH